MYPIVRSLTSEVMAWGAAIAWATGRARELATGRASVKGRWAGPFPVSLARTHRESSLTAVVGARAREAARVAPLAILALDDGAVAVREVLNALVG